MSKHNQRLTPAHKMAKNFIKEGLIGDILTFRTTFGHSGPETWTINPGRDVWFFNKEVAVMGAMADLGIHKTDLIDYNAFCIYKMKNGVIGSMTASWTYYGPEDNSTVIYGKKGIMRIYDDPNYSLKVELHNGEHLKYEIDSIQTNDNQTKSGVIDIFIDSIINDEETELSGKAALSSMRAVFAIVESSETGKRIMVDQD